MRNNLTDITLVVDRSGSMISCKEEAQNGINHFIDEQRKQEGECIFSLVQFDDQYDFVHKGVLIDNVGVFELIPRNMTALLDAVGRAINETGDRLEAMSENQRPGLVIIVIVTDGMENASKEFTKQQIKNMIEHQQKAYNWQFTFLGANQDAFAEASAIGITRNATANYTKADCAFRMSSANVSRMRGESRCGHTVNCCYTDEERAIMEDTTTS